MYHLAKRKRIESSSFVNEVSEAMGTEGIKRSHTIWFDDGSVILQAQKTQFCVHRSVLCNHSKVFQDMFTVPQPEAATMVNGLPLIHVIDDAVDWENLLGIIYFGLKMHGDYSVCSLISMMRLGHKYQFDDIKSAAVRRLIKEFPGTFADWTNESVSDPHHTIKEGDDYFSKGHEIDLINIALEVQCQPILPVLYYIFLRDRPLTEIFDGTMRKDRTRATLSSESQRTLILGRDNLLRGIATHTLKWLRGDVTDKCDSCYGERKRLLQDVMDRLHYDVSLALQDVPPILVATLCEECVELVEAEMAVGRRLLWDELPSYFDLPAWDMLLNFDN